MKQDVLNDKSVVPNHEIIYSIIGDKQLLWKQVISYVCDNSKDITEEWKYYNDGKSWLFRTMKRKKTLFWIRVLEDTFKIAFWFAERLEPDIMESGLPRNIKTEYKQAKAFNKSRCICIDMQGADDFEIVKQLIDLKLKH